MSRSGMSKGTNRSFPFCPGLAWASPPHSYSGQLSGRNFLSQFSAQNLFWISLPHPYSEQLSGKTVQLKVFCPGLALDIPATPLQWTTQQQDCPAMISLPRPDPGHPCHILTVGNSAAGPSCYKLSAQAWPCTSLLHPYSVQFSGRTFLSQALFLLGG